MRLQQKRLTGILAAGCVSLVIAIFVSSWAGLGYRAKYKRYRVKYNAYRAKYTNAIQQMAAWKAKQEQGARSSVVPGTKFPRKVLNTERGWSRYTMGMRTAPVDPDLAAPVFLSPGKEGLEIDSLYPVVAIKPVSHGDADAVAYYFEFDTAPSFDTPNLWRGPMLLAFIVSENLTSPQGRYYSLLQSQLRNDSGSQNSVKFPFRVTCMRLPHKWEDLDALELEKHALALVYGLKGWQRVVEAYNYVRYNYNRSSSTVMFAPLIVFKSKLGECGHVNALYGRLLELNGIRTRGVSGYCPRIKPIIPRGGHSALEVYDTDSGRWSYADPYLDILLRGLSAKDIGERKKGPHIWIYDIPERFDRTKFGKAVYLQDLFEYRAYYDVTGRSAVIQMEDMHAKDPQELRYGSDWDLPVPSREWKPDDLFKDSVTVYVRARYAVGKKRPADHTQWLVIRQPIRLSRWSATHFRIRPLRLLRNLERGIKPKSPEETPRRTITRDANQ